MRILFAGIIARYPFGGVTWCSLMYLLGLRALGHEVFYIEDTGECVYDPVQNTRATDPAYGTTYIHNALEPFGLGDRWSFVNYDGSYHGRSADEVRRYAPTPICSSTSPAARGSGATSTRGSRARCSSIPIRRSRSSPSPRPSRGTSQFFQRFDHLFTFGANIGTPASPIPTGDFTWHKTWQPITLDDWQTDARAARPLHDGDDLADRELHRRRRQQGSGVREVHRPAVADAAALRAGDQRPAAAAARARLGHGRRDAGVAHAVGLPRLHPRLEGRVRRRQAHLRRRTARAGSAIAPSAISRRAGRRSCRTPAGPRTCRPATGCSPSRRRTRRSPASIASTATTTGTRARAVEIAREHFDARAACCRRLLGGGVPCTAADRAHRAGRHDDSAAEVRARWRR